MSNDLYTLTQDDADRIVLSMPCTASDVLLHSLEEIAVDVGKLRRLLRRRLPDDDYTTHLLDRIGWSVETLDTINRPRASDIYRANVRFGASEDEAVSAALADVNARARAIRFLLGLAEAA